MSGVVKNILENCCTADPRRSTAETVPAARRSSNESPVKVPIAQQQSMSSTQTVTMDQTPPASSVESTPLMTSGAQMAPSTVPQATTSERQPMRTMQSERLQEQQSMRQKLQEPSPIRPLDTQLELNAMVETGKGEMKQSYGEVAEKLNMPVVGIFPASSRTGLAAIRAMTTFPLRNSCRKIQCVVKDESYLSIMRSSLGLSVTDPLSWEFADLNSERDMVGAFVGLDRLLLVPPNTEDRAEMIIRSIRAARLAGVKHVVLLSALVAQHPSSMFGKQFRQMETALEEMRPEMNYTFMRAAWFMDNFLDMAQQIMREGKFSSSWGPSGIAPVAISDVGRACAAVLCQPTHSREHLNRTYIMTGPDALSGYAMAEVLGRVLKTNVQYHDLPRSDMRQIYLDMGVPAWQADGYVEMNDLFKGGAASSFTQDVAKLTKGNHTSLERFLQTKKWFFLGHPSPLLCIMPASGRVGTATLTALLRDSLKSRIRAVVRNPTVQAELQAKFGSDPRLEIVMADFEQESEVRQAFDGVDNLVIIPPEKVEKFSLIDQAIKTAQDVGVVHTSLFSVTSALSETAIGRKFFAWEHVLRNHSTSFTIIQSNPFHDLMLYFADQAKKPDHVIHHWLGYGRFCPVDARDVGEALAAVVREGPIEHHGRTHRLYGPQPLNFPDMCRALSKVLGYDVNAVPDVSPDQIRAALDDKLPSFNVEEVIQAHETIAKGHDVKMQPDLLQLIGHAHSIQAFFEDYKDKFVMQSATPQS